MKNWQSRPRVKARYALAVSRRPLELTDRRGKSTESDSTATHKRRILGLLDRGPNREDKRTRYRSFGWKRKAEPKQQMSICYAGMAEGESARSEAGSEVGFWTRRRLLTHTIYVKSQETNVEPYFRGRRQTIIRTRAQGLRRRIVARSVVEEVRG